MDGKASVCVLGAEMVSALFPLESPLGKHVRVGGEYYQVIGVMAPAVRFPDAYRPRRGRRSSAESPGASGGESELATSEYRPILEWFASGNHIEVADDMPQAEYAKRLAGVKGLRELAAKHLEPKDPDEAAVAMELALEGLHQNSMLSRERIEGAKTSYKDMLKSMLSGLGED